MLFVFSVLSIVIGTLGALNQTKIKRLLGYSGISHMGFILLGFSILSRHGYMVSNLYLLVYMLMMISLFILITNVNLNYKYIIELGSLKFINKVVAISLAMFILSIAGIPPLCGFISKWFLLWTSIEHQYNVAAFIMILFSAIGAGYYLRIVKILYFQQRSSYLVWKNILMPTGQGSKINTPILGFLFFISLFLIINFSFILDFISINTVNLF